MNYAVIYKTLLFFHKKISNIEANVNVALNF